jgi:hypothetical protein
MSGKGLDTIGWYIVTLHQLLGHRKAAAALSQETQPGEEADCIVCMYEQGRATQEDVMERIGVAR